jgi:hypothetical protein
MPASEPYSTTGIAMGLFFVVTVEKAGKRMGGQPENPGGLLTG